MTFPQGILCINQCPLCICGFGRSVALQIVAKTTAICCVLRITAYPFTQHSLAV